MDCPIKHEYDQEGDVMYITFGEPRPCITTEVEGICIRKTKDGILNGITIVDYNQKISGK